MENHVFGKFGNDLLYLPINTNSLAAGKKQDGIKLLCVFLPSSQILNISPDIKELFQYNGRLEYCVVSGDKEKNCIREPDNFSKNADYSTDYNVYYSKECN